MTGWLKFLDRHATGFLGFSIVLALTLPDLASLMRPLLAPSVWGVLVLAMLRTDWAVFTGHLKRPGLVYATLAWLLLASPLAVWWAVKELGMATGGVGQAMILAAAAPPLMSSPALAMIIGLDGVLALLMVIASMVIVPLSLPVMTLFFLGITIEISYWEFAIRLLGVIGSALAVSFMMRRYLSQAGLAKISATADGMVVMLMLVFAVAIMDGVTARLLAEPLYVMAVLGLSFLFQALLQTTTAAIFLPYGRREAFTVGFLAGNRNMGLLLVVLPAGLHPDIALYFALAQFPVFILPAVLKPLYGRLLRPPPVK